MKDNFSTHADRYARFRPQYSVDVVEFIVSQVTNRNAAWDVGTGNGQLASKLASYFNEVHATDISENQLANAIRLPNVIYSKQAAEQTNFQKHQFDLITVAQAIHWFDLTKFYVEVKRTLKPDGCFAALGYGLSKIDGVDDILQEFYSKKVGPYWDPERKIIEQEYQSIPFPFDDLGIHRFNLLNQWAIDDLFGYLSTWSATRHYEKAVGTNPVKEFEERFRAHWGDDISKRVVTPVFVRIGKPR